MYMETPVPAFVRLCRRGHRLFLQMVGNSLRGVEEEIGVFSADVDDEDMLFPCLDFTLRVREKCTTRYTRAVYCCSAASTPFLEYVCTYACRAACVLTNH